MAVFDRRQFLTMMGAAGACPLPAKAAGDVDRKFLFIFNEGGWDSFCTFTPAFDATAVQMEPEARLGQYGEIPVVEHYERETFSRFMQDFGDRLCVINGIEARSITHQRCLQLMLTGSGGNNVEDWPVLLASHGKQFYPAPHVIFRGPGYSTKLGQSVVRVGENGQLSTLLNPQSLLPSLSTSTNIDALEDSLLTKRLQRRTRTMLVDEYVGVINQLSTVQQALSSAELMGSTEGCVRDIRRDAANAFSLFEQDFSRTAMISYKGVCDLTWDTHSDHITQVENHRDFFWYLRDIMRDLQGRQTLRGTALIDEVVVVVFSEMGRAPRFNSFGGRDHWTYTTALLMGAGVQGNQSIGALNGYGHGQAVDLVSGGLSSSGHLLLPQHFGATLLALGGVDPVPILGAEHPPISAAIL
jgi:uncharacterized protein (DUF1501 family)